MGALIMAGKKPDFNIRVKSKASGNTLYLAAFWKNEKGISGTLDRKVKKIVLDDNTIITPESIYLDLFVNEPKDEHDQSQPKAHKKVETHQAYEGDDDIPF